eukprot:gi/632970717/ref/XP_007901804.1/ PREDICTED: RNA-binding protein 20 [Callorhinchus milii]
MKKQSSDCGFEKRPGKGAIDREEDMASNVSDNDMASNVAPPQPHVVQSVAKLRNKNPFALSAQLSRSPLNPLLPSPASVQLAQLHAQLTLHRLKLAQSAVHNNTAAASVLNHVLSKVAMSQPLFNTLRTSSMLSPTHGQPGGAQMTVGIPGKAIGPGGLQFSAQAPGLPPMLGGGMNLQAPNPASIGLNPYVGLAPGQPATQPGDFSSKTSDREYRPADEARHNQGFHQYGAVGIPGKGQHFVHPSPHPGFQPDFQVPPTTTGGQQPGCRMPGPGFPGDRNTGTFPQNPEVLRLMDSGGQGVWAPEQWHNSAPFAQPSGGHEYPARSDNCWPAKSRPLPTANDLYNPEEPTGEAKLNLRGGSLFNRFRNFPGPPYGQSDNHSHLVPERQLQPHEHNDFHGIVPSQLPHICSICDKKVFNLKDWDQHVNGKHHIQNCLLFSENSDIGSSSFPRPANGSVNSGGLSTGSDLPSDIVQSHPTCPSTRTFLQSGTSFSSVPSGLKFPQRKSGPSRVVHICNIPEGSCTESDVINLGLPFGKVTNYILMRATSQAFLEMAYPEAAQAMVQFYQQKPPVFSEQQLLVRMSKQYKELKLKKPGKNVESIINDINSQREREVYKDLDRFPEERTRSRSPLARSSSPWMESHSPSFASCSSSQRSSISPRRTNQSPKATSRGERNNGTEQRGSWEYLAHTGRREEEKEDSISRSYGEESRDRTDKWGHDRKQHSKSSARLSPKSLEDRGDAAHRQKDKHVKSSPVPFQAKYKTRNEEDYRKEHKLKSTRSQHSPRSKGKESEFPQRSGNRGTSTSQDQTENRSEHDSHRSPVHANRLRRSIEKDEGRACDRHRQFKGEGGMSGSEAEEEAGNRCCSKESFSSPLSQRGSHELILEQNTNQQSPTWESGSEAEGEGWYQCRMEEFVTVDEVGGEEEHSMEVEAEKLEIKESDCVEPNDRRMQMSPEALVTKDMVSDWEKNSEDHCRVSSDGSRPMSPTPTIGSDRISMESVSYSQVTSDSIRIHAQTLSTETEQQVHPEIDKGLSDGESSGHLETAESQCKHNEDCDTALRLQEPEHSSVEVPEIQGTDQAMDGTSQDVVELHKDELHKVPPEALSKENSSQPILELPGNNEQVSQPQQSPLPREQDNVFCNLSIPLGVEFVEPRTGFYCKLCGIFYITEEAAKTSHCRSTIHYKNLQRYLSQLAEDSLREGQGDRNPGREEEVGIVPQFESKRSSPP